MQESTFVFQRSALQSFWARLTVAILYPLQGMIKYTAVATVACFIAHKQFPLFRSVLGSRCLLVSGADEHLLPNLKPSDPSVSLHLLDPRERCADALPLAACSFRLKGFLVSSATMAGLVIEAEDVLQKYEQDQRIAYNLHRRWAKIGLAREGRVPTESELERHVPFVLLPSNKKPCADLLRPFCATLQLDPREQASVPADRERRRRSRAQDHPRRTTRTRLGRPFQSAQPRHDTKNTGVDGRDSIERRVARTRVVSVEEVSGGWSFGGQAPRRIRRHLAAVSIAVFNKLFSQG